MGVLEIVIQLGVPHHALERHIPKLGKKRTKIESTGIDTTSKLYMSLVVSGQSGQSPCGIVGGDVLRKTKPARTPRQQPLLSMQ